MVLQLIYYVSIIIIIIYSFFIWIKYKKFFNNNVEHYESKLKNNKGLFIAIPCLREQKTIEETVGHFRKICNLPIVIITTQKECFESNYSKDYITTSAIVKRNILGKYNNVYLINYPFEKGYMADQLNFMLDNFKQLKFYDSTKEWYMALYNADSAPPNGTFESIFYHINRDERVIQQYSYCFKNFTKLDFISKGFAIYQSNFEIKVGLFNSYLNYKYLYNYVVGHGLVISLETLKKLGNFNTKFWCEDIYLTMKLKYTNISICPISNLENIENASSLKQIIKQNSVWYDTTKKYRKVYKDIKMKEEKKSFFGLVGCLNEFRCAINWLLFPIIFILDIVICICSQNNIILSLIILFFSYWLYSFINYYVTINTINRLNNENYKLTIYHYCAFLLALLISNVGPIYSLIFRKKEKYKTER